MKTRRKSKATTSATEATATTLELTLPEELDVDALSSLLPDVTLENPKGEDILGLYEVLLSRDAELEEARRALEEARGEVERAEVERDDALHQRESVRSEVEGELSRAQEELENVKKERDALKTTNASLQTQVSTITSTTSASSTEVESLKTRVADVEREKRDLLSVVSRMKEDAASQDEEVKTLRTTLKDLRTKNSDTESKARTLESENTSLTFRLESVEQQLVLAREEADRASNELTARSEQYSNDRRTLRAELSSLQTTFDELNSQHASLTSRYTALQTFHTTTTTQLSTAQSTIHDLRSRLAEQDASYASEVSGLKRLVEMMEAREIQGQAIVEGIQADYNGLGARAERREQVLRDEADRERARADEAERKRSELERVLEGLQSGELPLPEPQANGTPARIMSTPIRTPGSAFAGTPEGMLSPAAALASRVQRGGRTLTDVYADYVKLQQDYARKCAEHDRMDRTLSQVLDEIQERAPVLAQQRAEYERLKAEADDLAERLHDALAQRDALAQEATDAQSKLVKGHQEQKLLQAQLRDMGAQVQGLMKALARAQDPHLPPDEELEGMAVEGDSIDAVISNELVLVASIPALQARNQQLLSLVRKLGEQLEGEEREVHADNEAAIAEAGQALQQIQIELDDARRAGEAQSRALRKEIDTLKQLLDIERAKNGSSSTSSVAGQRAIANGEEAGELEELQAQFERFREEADVDGARLREMAFGAQREVAEVQAKLAKANANVEFLKERQAASADHAAQQQRELDALSTRHAQAQAQFAAADARAARFESELIDVRARADRAVGEAANARAEKRIIESSMNRLMEENKSLANQNSQLSSLVERVRVLQDDATHASERDRHRLERSVESLESQAEELKRQLNEERERLKDSQMRWEVEGRELREAKDKATSALLKAGEEAGKARAEEARLGARVEELTRTVQGLEEKLSVYERRGPAASSSTAHADGAGSNDAEVAELRAALKVAEVDLHNAREHAEQFKNIGRANEEALESLTATHEQYVAATTSQIAQLEADKTSLEQKIERLQREVLESKKLANESKRALTKERDAWASDRKTLEDTIVELSSSEQSAAAVQAAREAEAASHSARVKEAEDKYNREVLAHADALRQLEEVKNQIAELRTASHENLASAETARAKLSSAEGSWAAQREAMQKELEDVNARVKELNEQNKVLHSHLESVSAQAAQIRAAGDAATGEGAGEGEEGKDSEMRQVVSWLRREKEMAEMKLELNKQETARVRAQATHLARDLEEARAQLSEEREKAATNAGSEDVHKELVEKIGQMSVLRESNATLRADKEAGERKIRELEGRVGEMSGEIEPLKVQVRELRAEVEAKGGHVRRLEEESARWQARNSQLLAKYERIDPAELQAVRDELTQAQSDLEEKSAALQALTERAEAAEKAVEEAKAARQKFVARANETIGRLKNDTTALKQQNAQLTQEKQALTEQLATASSSAPAPAPVIDNSALEAANAELEKVKTELEVVKVALEAEKAKAVPVADTSALDARIAELTKERDELAEKVANAPSTSGTNEEWTAEKATLTAARDSALAEVKTLKDSLGKLESEVRGLKQQAGTFQARIKALTEKENKLQQEHAAKIEAAVADAVKNAPADSASSEDVAAKHIEELKALEERLHKEHEAALKQAQDAAAASSAAAPTAIEGAAEPADLEQKLKDAMEAGRKEADAKIRVKDNQLVRVQKRLKDLEAKVLEWEKEGKVPAGSTAAAPPARPAGTTPTGPAASTAPATTIPPPVVAAATLTPSASTSSAPGGSAPPAAGGSAPVTRAAAARGGAPPAAGIPRKPSLASAGPAATSAPGPAARGRGRGRGGPSVRGAPAAGGVSIMGAAGKRGREENDVGDALAKRLRPTEGVRGGRGRGRGGAGAGPSAGGDAA